MYKIPWFSYFLSIPWFLPAGIISIIFPILWSLKLPLYKSKIFLQTDRQADDRVSLKLDSLE